MQEENTNYTPPVYSADEPMIDKSTKAIPTFIGIAIIVIVIVLMFGGVFAYNYLAIKSQQNSEFLVSRQKTDQTAGWKTYTNQEYGFKLEYPANFKTIADVNPAGYLNLNLGLSDTPYVGDIAIQVKKNDRNETASQYFTREKVNSIQGFASKCQTCANMDVDAETYDCLANNSGIIKIAEKDGFFCKAMPVRATYPSYVFVFNEGYIYEFFDYAEDNPSYEIYKQILSTFKFITPGNQIDWTKYTNDQLMAMAYPDWQNQAMFFKGLEGNFLIIDQGTAPDPRGLIIYDLSVKKQVLSDSYSRPLDITSTAVSYWNPTSQKVTAQNCPDSVKWAQEGLGAGFEKQVSFSLVTLTKKDLGQTRCSPRQ